MTKSSWVCRTAFVAVVALAAGCARMQVAGIEVETESAGARAPWVIGVPAPPSAVASVGGPSPVLPVQPPLGVWLESAISVVPLETLSSLVQDGRGAGSVPVVVAALDAPDARPVVGSAAVSASVALSSGDGTQPCDRAGVPDGYSGPVPLGGVRVVAREVAPNASWWALGRRHALSYADLARLNGVEEAMVRAGRGLVAGARVYVVERSGPTRRGAQAWCTPAGRIAGDDVWRIYPEGRRWRPALARGIAGDVPALHDPDALWVERPGLRTFAEWAARGRVSIERLLRYNGVDPDAVGGDARPRGAVALPARLSG